MNHSHPDGRLVLASQNRHKLAELRDLLARAGLDPTLLEPAPPGLEVVEDGETFAENAIKKAVTVARITGCRALADDSGLEVEALDGHPGVRSARFAGEPANDENNNRKILELLAGQSNRRARFRCVLALSDAEGRTRTVEGRCEGVLGLSPRGKNGFGYDPLFIPDGHDQTFAELPADVKNRISHRARALEAARKIWFSNDKNPAGDGI